jgi:hypothetical protein
MGITEKHTPSSESKSNNKNIRKYIFELIEHSHVGQYTANTW